MKENKRYAEEKIDGIMKELAITQSPFSTNLTSRLILWNALKEAFEAGIRSKEVRL